MKGLIILFCLFLSVNAFGQRRDTVYVNAKKQLVLKSAARATDRSLIQVDGKDYNGTLESIDLKTVKSFDILKAKDAVVLFGPKGKNGAIFITKIDTSANKIANENFQRTKNYINNATPDKPAIIVNHIIYKGNLDAFSPIDITNVDIVDRDYTLANYGIKSINGAVIISTKQKIDPAKGLFIQ